MKVILERSPTRKGGSLSVWGSCFASAEELLFVERQMLEDFLFVLGASLQGFGCGRREKMEAGNTWTNTA